MRTLGLLVLVIALSGCEKPTPPPPPAPPPVQPQPIAGGNVTPNPVNLTDSPDVATGPGDAYEWGWLGVSLNIVPPESRGAAQLPEGGALVKGLADGSPAKDKLQPGDILVKANDEAIDGIAAFLGRIRAMKGGSELRLSLVREGKPANVEVKVGVRKAKDLLSASMNNGIAWLKQQQRAADGAWEYPHPSRTGGESTGKPHSAVTALVVAALAGVPADMRSGTNDAVEKGIAFLKGRINGDGIVDSPADEGIAYRSYATALTAIAMARHKAPGDKEALDKVLAGLRKSQLAEGRELSPLDWTYGSWNTYDGEVEYTRRGDMSCMGFVLQAFYEGGAPADDPAVKKAYQFVKKSQNISDSGPALPEVDDGGFAFNPRTGKAGYKQLNAQVSRNYSYGSTTADGLRSLMYCVRKKDDPRVAAAFDWLSRNFAVDKNPGFARDGHEPPVRFDQGIHFYYLHSLATALDLAAPGETILAGGNTHYWAVDILQEINSVQRKDGHWQNTVNVMNEDDPDVATPLALLALESIAPHIK